jgi:GDPmannose 4,6-dehydratase
VIGASGQDGYYLSEFLLNYEVELHLIIRSKRINELQNSLFKSPGVRTYIIDVRDTNGLLNIIKQIMPDEIYNLAGLSSVAQSFLSPELTFEINYYSVKRLLDGLRKIPNYNFKFYQASSSEIFGSTSEIPQDESTALAPISPYGESKARAHEMCEKYRNRFGIFISIGILYNHESPIRPKNFVSRKISHGIASIKLGLARHLELGSLSVKRDWGFAGDYVKAMNAIIQFDQPETFVVATGKNYSVKDFVKTAMKAADLQLTPEDVIRSNKDLERSKETNELVGNSSKILNKLGWAPEVGFQDLVTMMVNYDLHQLSTSGGDV